MRHDGVGEKEGLERRGVGEGVREEGRERRGEKGGERKEGR